MNKKSDALMSTYLKEKVSVIHATFDTGLRPIPNSPHTVAFVEVDKSLSTAEKLEFAFVKTNTINKVWWDNKEVTAMFPNKTCRSTAVGDMVLIGNVKYKCEPTGWNIIESDGLRQSDNTISVDFGRACRSYDNGPRISFT